MHMAIHNIPLQYDTTYQQLHFGIPLKFYTSWNQLTAPLFSIVEACDFSENFQRANSEIDNIN